jgi:hypothetical protein
MENVRLLATCCPAHQLIMHPIDWLGAIRAPEPERCPQQGQNHDVTTRETTQTKGPYNMTFTDTGLTTGTQNYSGPDVLI